MKTLYLEIDLELNYYWNRFIWTNMKWNSNETVIQKLKKFNFANLFGSKIFTSVVSVSNWIQLYASEPMSASLSLQRIGIALASLLPLHNVAVTMVNCGRQ